MYGVTPPDRPLVLVARYVVVRVTRGGSGLGGWLSGLGGLGLSGCWKSDLVAGMVFLVCGG